VALGATFRAAQKNAPEKGDALSFVGYTVLVLGLSVIIMLGR
jgi:hypothetical protein